jgi:hypothetical protein
MNIVILEQISDLNLFIACDLFVVGFAKAFWNLFIFKTFASYSFESFYSVLD